MITWLCNLWINRKIAIIAALLMAVLLIAYQTFFMQSTENPPPLPKAETPGTKPAPAPAPAPAPTPAAAAPLAAPTVPDRTASVETPLYRAAISSRGGAITVWTALACARSAYSTTARVGVIGRLRRRSSSSARRDE